MKWGKFWKVVVLSLVAVIAIAAVFIVVVVRSRPRFEFGFLQGHQPISSGMNRIGIDTDLDAYSWQESWIKVENRIHDELRSWKRSDLGDMGVLFEDPNGTYVSVSKGKGNYPMKSGALDKSPDWITIQIWKNVPEGLVSKVRILIEDWKGNHEIPLSY